MAYTSLYRRYRPDTFRDVIGQNHVVKTLVNQIKSGNIGHAYLFTGTRGTGKTSVAKIFSRAVNCLHPEDGSPCGKCEVCMELALSGNFDILEIDAASNNSVDQIRELTDKINFPPTVGKYKVYIIDEVHMLSKSAHNALLKTLEEPPEGVTIFLGAANEAGILDTVKSRCRKIYIDVFDRETVYNALRELNCDAESASIAAACCEGQLGKARSIAFSPEYKERYSDALALLETLKKSRDILSAENIPSFRNGETDFLKILSVALRDVIAAKEGAPLFFEAATASRLNALAEDFSLRALALSVDAVNKAQEKLSYGVNSAAVCDSLLFTILEVKHKWQS